MWISGNYSRRRCVCTRALLTISLQANVFHSPSDTKDGGNSRSIRFSVLLKKVCNLYRYESGSYTVRTP